MAYTLARNGTASTRPNTSVRRAVLGTMIERATSM